MTSPTPSSDNDILQVWQQHEGDLLGKVCFLHKENNHLKDLLKKVFKRVGHVVTTIDENTDITDCLEVIQNFAEPRGGEGHWLDMQLRVREAENRIRELETKISTLESTEQHLRREIASGDQKLSESVVHIHELQQELNRKDEELLRRAENEATLTIDVTKLREVIKEDEIAATGHLVTIDALKAQLAGATRQESGRAVAVRDVFAQILKTIFAEDTNTMKRFITLIPSDGVQLVIDPIAVTPVSTESVTIHRTAYECMGTLWKQHPGYISLEGVDPGSPADAAGCALFVGRRLRTVSGAPIGTVESLTAITTGMTLIDLCFHPADAFRQPPSTASPPYNWRLNAVSEEF
eukprot:TRINITY_DN8699_c0_g1_i1.p1 TRINITY_DN8699_c0_g1~~TRINITY_DN8699_c0_g1_i1.p1  ORF type:complete len:350 (+),score=78.79 TRINITY_DN8699_c0_g1_i1:80-1129(+)